MPDTNNTISRNSRQDGLSRMPPTTIVLCALCILVTVARSTSAPGQGLWSRIGHMFDYTPEDVWNGHYYFLVTAMLPHSDFLHGMGATHIIFNMIWLYQVGGLMEIEVGPLVYASFVVMAAAIGTCCEIALSGQPGIGASGVVYAIFGLVWMGRYRYDSWRTIATPDNMRLMIGWGLLCMVATYMQWMQVANGAHVGGFLFGLSVGGLCFARRRRTLWALPLAALGVVCTLSLSYLPWSIDWTFYKATIALDRRQYATSIKWYRRCLKDGCPPYAPWHNMAVAWQDIAFDAQYSGDTKTFNYAMAQEATANAEAGPDPDADQ